MAQCNKKHATLYVHNELNEQDKIAFELHMKNCPACQHEVQELHQFLNYLPNQPLLEPDVDTMNNLRRLTQFKLGERAAGRHSFRPQMALQFLFAFVLLLSGFFIGTVKSNFDEKNVMANLLTANDQVLAKNGSIRPYLYDINKVEYNPEKGTIDVLYNTVNDIQISAKVNDPKITELLKYALTQDKLQIKFHALKTLMSSAHKNRQIDPELLESMQHVLQYDENLGVKLLTLKALRAFPMTSDIKTAFTQVLLFDKNEAMRIEAFDALVQQNGLSQHDLETILLPAQNDENNLISHRAERLIQTVNFDKNKK